MILVGLPKGRIYKEIKHLLKESGIDLSEDKRKLIVEEKINPLFQNNLSYGFSDFNDLQIFNIIFTF